jgi:vacuolar-type H+-ATPase subunit E/Vma4
MKSVEENIELLERAILADARADAEQILTQAQTEADAIRQRAQKQAAAEREEILQRAAQEADRLRSQAVATTQLKARTLQLDHREKLLDKVFAAAREQLPSVEQWNNYDQIAFHLLREAITQLGEPKINVKADATTGKLLTQQALDEIEKEMKVSLHHSSVLEKTTGVVVESNNGHLHYDNTLQTRLNRLQSILRSPVYHLLMGETL